MIRDIIKKEKRNRVSKEKSLKTIIPKIRFNEFENIWTKSKLGELYEIYSGNTPSRSDNMNYQNGEIPWIKTTDLNNSIICSNEEKISVYGATKLKLLPENSVLIAMYGGFNQIGRTGLLAYPATINQALAALMPVNEINPNFLLNFLNFKKESWRNVAASSRKDPNITKNDVEKFIISFPSLEEQSAIGTLFRTLDDLLASYKDNLANYQSLKATMLTKMFPKAGQTVPEIRLDGFDGEWENKILSEVTNITMGQSPKSENYTDNSNDYILVQGNADIKDKQVVPRLWTTEVTKMAEIGDIILTVRAPVGDIGKTDFNVVIGRGVAAIKGNDFIFYTLEKMKMTGFWNRFSTGSTFESISSNDIKEAIIQLPTLEEQQAIGAYFSNLDNLIAAHQEKIYQLETLKKKLLQDMFI